MADEYTGRESPRSSEPAKCFPAKEDLFNAFSYFGPNDTRVVIIGQESSCRPGQAHGLALSVPPGQDRTPGLQNILAEIARDLPGTVQASGCLEGWAKQGVLLLNGCLSVRANQPGSHAGQGWERATDAILEQLQEANPKIVYLLWGNFAKTKRPLINYSLGIFEAAHPSPLTAYQGFNSCGHFSKTNELLVAAGMKAIDWST